MKRLASIFFITAVLLSAGNARAETTAPAPNENGTKSTAGTYAMSLCSDFWELKSEDDINQQTIVLDATISAIRAHDDELLQTSLDAVDASQKEIDGLNQLIDKAGPVAMLTAGTAGQAATKKGDGLDSLFSLLRAADARNEEARSATYNLMARIQGIEAIRTFVYACAKDQRDYLKDAGKGTGPTPSPAPSAGLNPVGVWQHFEKGQLVVTLTIGGGPADFGGQVVWNLGLTTLAGTISIHQQSENVFAGSLTNRVRTEGVKMTLAQDGKTMTLTGKGTGQIIFTRQK